MINISVTGVQQAKDAIQQELKKLMTDKAVLVGIQEDAGMASEGFSMAQLGATLHFGADIDHPGGTAYGYRYKADVERNRIRFLKPGQGYAVLGVTGPHKINIPARPWLDVGVQSGSPDYIEAIENSNGDLDNALEIIGQIAVGKVQQYMTDLRDPPNAPSTIKKKGSSNPLINNGHLRQSVTYKIETGLPDEGMG